MRYPLKFFWLKTCSKLKPLKFKVLQIRTLCNATIKLVKRHQILLTITQQET